MPKFTIRRRGDETITLYAQDAAHAKEVERRYFRPERRDWFMVGFALVMGVCGVGFVLAMAQLAISINSYVAGGY